MKGKTLGSRYKILEYLAEGGFGRTYLAEDTQLPGKNTCIVKQLYPSSQKPRLLEIARRLFKTEASVLHNLGHHQQIPELLAYFEEESKFYLVQQYIKGKTLATELNSEQTWSQGQVIELLQDVLNILQFIHAQGVIHRDIKPDNLIRRQSDRRLILVDFGTVKQVLQGQQTNLDQLTVAVGTQGYMPTEQARGKPHLTSDLYALGMIGIEALTGIIPIELEEDDRGEIIWQHLANVSPNLAQILTQMTRCQVEDRYQSATEILQDLHKLARVNITEPQSVTAIDSTKIVNQSRSQSIHTGSVRNNKVVALPVVNNQTNVDRQSAIADSTESIPATTIDRPSSANPNLPVKSRPKGTIFAILALVATVAVVGTYFFLEQLNPESTIDLPQTTDSQPNNSGDRESESLPANPTERMPQGEGFRDDL